MKCRCGCGRDLHGNRKRCTTVAKKPSRIPYRCIERVEAEARAARIYQVMQREPDLEPWQLMERFNLNEREFDSLRVRIRRTYGSEVAR